MATQRIAPPANSTPLHRLIDTRLQVNGHPTLYDIVEEMRPQSSWDSIARTISGLSGEHCSNVNLINWFVDKKAAA